MRISERGESAQSRQVHPTFCVLHPPHPRVLCKVPTGFAWCMTLASALHAYFEGIEAGEAYPDFSPEAAPHAASARRAARWYITHKGVNPQDQIQQALLRAKLVEPSFLNKHTAEE